MNPRPLRIPRALAALCLTACAAASAAAQDDPRDMPWALRDHFNFPRAGAEVYLSSTHGDWSVKDLVGRTGWSVTLGGGETAGLSGFPPADVTRKDSEHPLGPVMRLTSQLTDGNGLRVTREWYAFKGRSMFLIRTYVANSGEAPVELAAVHPLILEGEGLAAGPGVSVYERRMRTLGGRYVYDPAAAPLFHLTRNAETGRSVTIAVLPGGQSEPRMELREESGRLLGAVISDFDPGVALQPGESVEADAIWLCVTNAPGQTLDRLFAWSAAALRPAPASPPPPRAWVEAPEGGGWNDIVSSPWLGGGVRHALLPLGWESSPGSLEGDPKRFKGGLGDLVKRAAKEGLALGVTLDPLAIEDGEPEWSAVTTGGGRWLNPASPEGRAAAAKRLGQLAQEGAAFVAVAPSAIPGAVLLHFNLSRAEVGALAYDLVTEAVAPLPVVPAAAATLPLDRDAWLAASAATSGLANYDVRPGPVRLDASSGGAADEETLSAISLYGGPVALAGAAGSDTARAIRSALSDVGMEAWACDLHHRAPLCWALVPKGGAAGALSYLLFQGAERPEAYIRAPAPPHAPPARLWTNGPQEIALADFVKAHELSRNMQVVAVAGDAAEPFVLNVTPGSTMRVHDVEHIEWDPKEGRAAGVLRGSGRGSGSVYVVAPTGWTLRKGQAGGARLKQNGERAIEVSLEANARKSFELEFQRN